MFGWGESQDAYQQMCKLSLKQFVGLLYANQLILTDNGDNNQPQFDNQSSLGHEVIAGGAAFAGFKAFEDHQRSEGKC